ncbi:hypothetical protein SSX86_000128 [Deinandra increscens subsp. villosa]|uniref:Acyl-[acyl-carrier-protein] hydrolase n=1 Tax=Deinandra increscens subsp. villosa TaxID=3103831 RepID=A0AAP0HF07_9ASTR
MATISFSFLNSLSPHRIIKKNDASSWGLVVKDLAKINTSTSVGVIRTTFLKPKMMLNKLETYPYTVPGLGLGGVLKDEFVFQQKFHIRSYEVGPDKKITAETLMSLLQETALNHLKTIGVWVDGLGLTREMCNKKLIWVAAKQEVVVDRYPIWGDVIQINTWKGAYGKIGMCSNWAFYDDKTGDILLRASSILVMMNEETRRLSKFPDEVRGELNRHFTYTTPPTVKEETRKWSTRDRSTEDHIRTGLTPTWSDLDMNQHVNNMKYAGWIIESVPRSIVKNYELASMTLEYSRECRMGDVLQSRTYVMGIDTCKLADYDHVDCEHVIQLESTSDEIMKAWTTWRSKKGNRLE